jgi:hypothetical protein
VRPLIAILLAACALAQDQPPVFPNKPAPDGVAKPKSVKRMVEDFDVITNSEWAGDSNFEFINGAYLRVPFKYGRASVIDFALYPKISSAIKKWDYDAKTQTIEAAGESHGLRMHSWIKVDQRYLDLIEFNIVRGDMTGFKIKVYLWEKEGKTLVIGKGEWPGARLSLPTLVRLVFKPVSEIVLGIATRNFRSYIEEDYRKKKSPPETH